MSKRRRPGRTRRNPLRLSDRENERRKRLSIEPLETRCLLAIDMVTSDADDGGAGTLRSVIANASSGDTIEFASGLSPIDLTQGQIEMNKSLSIVGPGASSLTVDQTTSSARVFLIDAVDSSNNPVTVAMSGLTLTGGDANDFQNFNVEGGAIYNQGNVSLSAMVLSGNVAESGGGAIANIGVLTITDSTISSNSAFGGGAITNLGGGILSISDSTVSDNSATVGAGISNGGTLTVTGSTFSGNAGSDVAGAIENFANAVVTNSTFFNNSSGVQGGGIDNSGGGGVVLTVTGSTFSGNSAPRGAGITNYSGTAYLANSVVVGNSAGQDPDVYGVYSATDHNLIGVMGDATGFDASNIVLNSDDVGLAGLGPLADNGGPTQTMALLPGSPAIDAGDNSPPSPFPTNRITDQRGLPRLVNAVVDMGAYEVQSTSFQITSGGVYTLMLLSGTNFVELVAPNGNIVSEWSIDTTPSLTIINSSGQPVQLVVDSTNGALPIPVTFDGGASTGSSLVFQGGTSTSDTYAPGPTLGQGTNTLVIGGVTESVNFMNLTPVYDSVAGPLTVDGTNSADTIDYTEGNDTTATPNTAWGQVTVNNLEAINFTDKSSLTINSLASDDTFNLSNPHTPTGLGGITVNGGDPAAGGTVNFSGATGPVTVNEGDNTIATKTVVSGYSVPVTLSGMATANLDAGGDGMTATGTSQNDNWVFTPTGATAGTFYDDVGSGNNLVPNTVFNIANVSGNFRVFNDPSGNADQVTLRGTDARDLFEINQGSGVAQVLANNVNGLLPVELGISAEILNVLGLGGENTFQVVPAPGIAGQAQDNLLINLDGGDTSANNTLVLGSSFGAAPGMLAANQFVVVNKSPLANNGVVRVFTAAVPNPDINYQNIQTVSANVAGGSLNPNLLVMGPDLYEPNDKLGTATFLGSQPTIEVQHATIFPGTGEQPGTPADNDYYRVVPQITGTLDFQVSYRTFNPALLPGGGNLSLQVLDANGNVLGTGSTEITVPAVAGQTYFLHVSGASASVVNGYDATIINTATLNLSAAHENVTIRVDPADPTIVQVVDGATVLQQYANDSGSHISIVGDANNNTVTVDSSFGLVNATINFDGGGGDNTLILQQTGGDTQSSDIYSVGPNPGEGSDVITGTSGTQSITFENLAPVQDNVPATTATVDGTNGDNAITYAQGPGGGIFVGNTGFVTVDNQESYEFNNKTNLVIDSLAGNDTINLNDPTTPAGLTGTITVNGTAGANDALTVNGNATIGYTPTGPGAGNVTTAGNPTVTFTNVTSASIVGDGAGDVLTLGNAGNLFAQFTAGDTADSGSLTMQFGYSGPSATPLSFSNLGFGGGLSVLGGGFGSLDVNGPAVASTFNLSPTGVVQLFKPLGAAPVTVPITTTDAAVRFIGHSGSDTFNIPGDHPFAFGLEVEGDAGTNTLNFTGDGAAPVTVNLGSGTVDEAGFGTVTFLGIDTVNVNAGGAALTVVDGNANTNLAVTPTGAAAAMVHANGTGPLVHVTGANASGLVANLTGGGSTLSVDGATTAQTFTATNTSVTVTGDLPVDYTAAQLAALDINGTGGGNSLVVDSTAAAVVTPIVYSGGAGAGNSLTLTGGTATTDVYTPGPNGGQGSDTLTFGAAVESIQFSLLTPVTDNVAGPLTVNGTTAGDAITAGATANMVTVNKLESITFANKTNLTLNGNGGNDTFNISPANITLTAAGAIAVTGAAGANDTLTVNGTKTTGYTPSGSGFGSITTTGNPTVAFTNTASVAIVGDGVGDTLTLGNAGNLFAQFTAGATTDSGSLTMQFGYNGPSATPLSFSNLGFSGGLSVLGGGFGSLDINGPNVASEFNLSSAGVVQLFKPLGAAPVTVPVTTTDAAVRFIGHSGSDTFNVPGNHPFGFGLEVEGAAGSNTLNFTGDGTAPVTVNLGSGTVDEAGFASVTFLGIGTVNVNANGAALTVDGTAGPDNLTYTPTGAAAGTVTLGGLNTVLNVRNVSAAAGGFTIDAAGGADTVTVNGTNGADVIGVVKGATTTVQVNSFLTVNLPASDENVDVAAGNGADTINVSGTNTTQGLDIQGGEPGAIDPAVSDQLNVTLATAGMTDINEGATPDTGTVFNPDGNINFTGMEVLSMTGTAAGANTIQAEGTDGNDAITLSNDSGVVGGDEYYINNAAVILFTNFQTANIGGNFGDDTLKVAPTGLLGVTTVNVSGSITSVDSLTVFGGDAAPNTVAYNPAAIPANVAITGAAVVNFNATDQAVAHVAYVGKATDDLLTVNVPAGSTTTYTVGSAPDSGSVQVDSLVPFTFSNLGNIGQAVSVAAAGAASLVDNGTAANDTFTVTGLTGPTRGQVQLNNDLPLQTDANVTGLTLNGLAGDNTYTVTATAANPLPYTTINVNGSGTADPDVLNLNGDGTAVTANVGTATPSVTGGGLGTVDVSGVGTVHVNAGASTLSVTGTPGADMLAVTPTGANAATIQDYTGGTAQNSQGGALASLTPVGPVFNAANVSGAAGSFTVNGNGGSDALFVEGTQNADTIDINDAASGANAVKVNALLTVNYNAAMAQVEVDGLAGSDTINIAPSTTTSFLVDGGDPIGVQPGDVINLLHPPGPYQIFPGPTKDSGGLKTPGFQTVSWAHIETVLNTGGGPPIITGTNGNDEITVIARDSSYNPANPGVPNPLLDGVQDFTVSVNDGPDMLFINTPDLFIDALSGNDDIVVREPAPNQAAWNVQVFVAGGAPASGANRLGDNVELETPGTQSVTYSPNNPVSAVPAVPGVTISAPGAGAGQFNDTTSTSTISATEFLFPGFYQSSAGGAENFVYAGEAGNDTLTYNTPANANVGSNLVYTPGATPDAGAIIGSQSGGAALTPLIFSGLGTTGTVSFTTANAGRTDHLNVEGVPTSSAESFSVTPANAGTVQLSQLPPANGIVTVPITTSSVNTLELDGLGGSDQFNLTGPLPYTDTIIDDGAAVSLTGATGAVSVNVADNALAPPTNSTVTGYGGTVTLVGVETANLDAGGNATSATGTSQNDNFIYTPSGATAGSFYDTVNSSNNVTSSTLFHLSNVGGPFTVFGGAGGNSDQVTVEATDARDLIEINQGTAIATVLANNINALLPVQLATNVQVLNAVGEGGQNTFQVIPTPGLAGSPDNLLINVDGGANGQFNALVIGASFGNAPGQLAANQFVVVNKNPAVNSGTVRVFTAAVADPDINYKNIQAVSPNVAGTSLNPNLLVMGADVDEPNDKQANATFLGSGAALNVQNATIFASNSEFPGEPADQDYYQVVAQTTGTLDFQVYFRTYNPALLPGGGNLNLEVLDSSGNVIATASGGAAQFGADPSTGDARIRIPAVAGQSYYLHVFGATIPGGGNNGSVVNAYNMTIINTAPPTPFNLELSRSVPAADAGSPDTGDLPPNAPGDDSGRSQLDNVTNDNTPRIYFRLSDSVLLNDLPGNGSTDTPPAGVIPIPFSPNGVTPGFRVAIFDGGNTQAPVGFASQVAGFPGLYEFDFTTPLADGIHNITAEVQMVDPQKATETGFGATSAALSITIDTVPPPVAFGSTGVANSGLVGPSDSGVPGQPATIVDRITNVSTPTLYGVAEANSIVRLYDDLNGDGVVDAGDVLLGQATAIPVDGANAAPNGQWTITSNVDLNNAKLGFPLDDVRNLLVTGEDLAGNVSAPSKLSIFVDTQGPTVNTVSITGATTFPLFNTKLTPTATASPTPLINSLDVTFNDQPIRVGPDFVYPAVNPALAETTSNYALVGEKTGVIPITSVTLVDNTASGTPGMTTVTLHFPPQFTPLPDDRYTLTVSNQITDNPGNPLQGNFNGGSFPSGLASGNGSQGASFVGAFTVNSRAHLGTYSAGTVDLDINGNGVFDPNNPDAANRDATVTLGYPSDRLFSGNFSTTYGAVPPAPGVANGFDKLAAYGEDATGQWRFLYDLSGTGGAATQVNEPFAIDGLPVAGNFDGSAVVAGSNPPVTSDGDQVGLFDGKAWYLDVLNQGYISAADIAAPATAVHPAGKLVSDMVGLPFVGIFDGFTDLGTYQNDGIVQFDLASLDPGHILTGNWNVEVNITNLFLTGVQASIPFNAVTERPFAGYFNGLGQEASLGFYVPGGTTNAPGTGDWYIFEPTNSSLTGAPPIPAPSLFTSGQVVTATAAQQAALQSNGSYLFNIIHPFKDQPLGGTDVFAQFDDQFSLPVVGVWDPPALTGGSTNNVTPSSTGAWISDLYNQLLGRNPSASELTNWVNAVNQGLTPSQVAQFFVTSNEYRANVINQLYEQYLGRAADPSGTAWWTAIWNATGGPEEVQAGIIGSAEFYATAGKQYPNLSPDAAWVTALYHDLLHRDVDPQGLAFWVNFIQTNTKQSVVLGFVTSAEYRLNLIDDWFQTYLGRSLDAGSGQTFLQQMENGFTQDALLEFIVSSQEYINKQ